MCHLFQTLSVCGCLYSSHQLKLQQLESACITAYATGIDFCSSCPCAIFGTATDFLVGCLLVNPVWNYYEVNQKIAYGAVCCGRKAADVATVRELEVLVNKV